MSERAQQLAARVRERFGDQVGVPRVAFGQVAVDVPAEHLVAVCTALRDEPEFAFAELIDLAGVDYLDYGKAEWETSELASSGGFSRGVEKRAVRPVEGFPERFAVVYQLLSIEHNRRLRLRCFAPGDPPQVDSVVGVWASANWFEREAFDLFGILFAGHPDLRRILTDYGFIGHPFRKDFPLIGEVEMRYDPELQRVIYEPVSIEPRTLVPRVIRRETPARAAAGAEEGGDA